MNDNNLKKDKIIEERAVELNEKLPYFTMATSSSKPIDTSLMTGQQVKNSNGNKDKNK